MRKLDEQWMHDLQHGPLRLLLQAVRRDDTLALSIRDNYINIYYRGGNLLKVARPGAQYACTFDFDYCRHLDCESRYEAALRKNSTPEDWLATLPLAKAEMDLWFYEHPKPEREFQQLIFRENNRGAIAAGTDYFIADMEYADSGNRSRFDLLGIRYPADGKKARRNRRARLAVMEFKYGDGAIDNKSGMIQHLEQIRRFFAAPDGCDEIRRDSCDTINQLLELGLIDGIKGPLEIEEGMPEVIFLFANHNPRSVILQRAISAIRSRPELLAGIEVKAANASCLGYGLYVDHLSTLDEFAARLEGGNHVE